MIVPLCEPEHDLVPLVQAGQAQLAEEAPAEVLASLHSFLNSHLSAR
jgi:hypothetical protein